MAITKFMQVCFSASDKEDEELLNQVANDIKDAKKHGSVSTDEVEYVNLGEDKVLIVDHKHGEATIAEGTEDPEQFDLIAVPTEEMDKFLHPLADGVTPNSKIKDHVNECAWDHAGEYEEPEKAADMEEPEDEKKFSVSTDNTAVLRVFSDQYFCERVFSDVLETEESTTVGNLQIEKVDDNEVLVTDKNTGDQASVTFDGDEIEVTEVDQRQLSYSEVEQYEPVYVVGIDRINNQLVSAPVYDHDDAEDLADRLEEMGVEAVEIFDDPQEAEEHADDLLGEVEATEVEENAEPCQADFSDCSYDLYLTRYFCEPEESYYSEYYDDDDRYYSEEEVTDFMVRMFSETEDECECQDKVEDALESGEQVEDDEHVVTPIDKNTVIVEDKESGEFTKVTADGDEFDTEAISEDEADELTDGLATDDDEDDDEEEKDYSDLEIMTDFMQRMYSENEDECECQDKVEDALESGEQVEDDEHVITPISDDTVVVEDKDSGEFTRVTADGDDFDTEAISEDEAHNLIDDANVDDDEDDDEDEKDYSEVEVTDFMLRLFSESEDDDEDECECQDKVEDALARGEQIEDDEHVVTPIDNKTAIVEDKDSGEFTKVTADGDEFDVKAISEDEADELTSDIAVSDKDEEEQDRKFSTLNRFYARNEEEEMAAAQEAQAAEQESNLGQIQPEEFQQDDSQDPNNRAIDSVENIEDKALNAVQAIQNASNTAVQEIMAAKEAPAPTQEEDLQEAQFSDYDFYDEGYQREFTETESTLESWLNK